MSVQKIVKRLIWEFAFLWALAALLAICYETELFTEGACTEGTAAYILEVSAVLLTLCTVPVALKISGAFLRRRLAGQDKEEAMKALLKWSEVQLFMLAVVVLVDISVYYTTMESLGILCAAVGLVASLLCFPSRTKIENYLSNLKEPEL